MIYKMRIAIVTPGWLPVPAVDGGAIEVLITEIIKGNEKNELFNIDLYTIHSDKLKSFKYNKTKIIPIKDNLYLKIKCRALNFINKLTKNENTYFSYNQSIISKIKKNKYDYIIVENNLYLYKDIYYNTSNKDNLIFHVHNDIIYPNNNLCNLILDTAHKIITVSEFLKQQVNKVKSNKKTFVLYNCVDQHYFCRSNVTNLIDLKNKYKIDKDDIIVMYAGRINKDKGVLELVKAFKMLDNNPNLKLIIVGSSWFNIIDKDDYLEEVIRQSDSIKNRIIFTGYVFPKDMPNILGLADLGVIPSLWEEVFGVIALEMMSMEIPIINTISGGLPEVVDEKCAILIPRDKNLISNLSSNIELLISNEALRMYMGKNGRKRIESTKEFHQDYYYDNFAKIILDK